MFRDGWGDPSSIDRFTPESVDPRAVPDIEPTLGEPVATDELVVRDGWFTSPAKDLPETIRRAQFRWMSRSTNRAACLVLAGSREEGYGLRTSIHAPLVAQGVDMVFLENPYYGTRRPIGAVDANLRYVSDQTKMHLATMDEAIVLLRWMRARYARVAVAGYSMGGFMAALVGALSGERVAVAALAAGGSPAPVYTAGLLSRSVAFDALGAGDEGRARLASVFDRADLCRLPLPLEPRAASIVAMTLDGYVPRRETERLARHWRGSALRFELSGHISAVFTRRQALRRAIRESLDRLS